ncbi:hypothetical protein H4R18_004774 [Coemansia javaensis]|uniref:sn-1-specific diacylglycerol lipase n=1 Tax=Coemansia javaensis TaxID=2761396 RepID=A0A9W8LFT6_9FUNG|nr:hypothetical protein H4R18_004774 [Coemansia javaensis]
MAALRWAGGCDGVLGRRDLRQPLNLYRVPDGIMQVFLVGLHQSSPVNRPYVVVRLGEQTARTTVSKSPTGDWGEGFELAVSYHTQLFGTVHMDVYSSNTLLPDTFVGRAEIKISQLAGFPEVFTSYYEIWDKSLAASTVPDQRQRSVVSRNLGALQVRINYRFQAMDDPEPAVSRARGAHLHGISIHEAAPGRDAAADPSGGSSGPAAMSTDELIAAFAEAYAKCAAATERHCRSATDGRAAAERGAMFAQVDDEEPAAPSGNSSSSSSSSSAAPGWFFGMLGGSQLAPDAAASETATAATTTTKPAAEAPAAAGEKTLIQSLAGMFVSPSTLMVLKSLERLVVLFNQGVELSSKDILGGLLALYKFHSEADIPGVSRPHPGAPIEGAQALELPARYARFALAAYGWRALYFFNRGITLMDGARDGSDVTSVLQYLHLAREDLLGYEFRSVQLFCPSYFVAHDRQHGAVVLVVRGTMSAEDAVVDLACEYTKWNGGLVHSGMKASAHWLFARVLPHIFAYAGSHGVRAIRIVGHSLGASTAAILAIMIAESRARMAAAAPGADPAKYDIKTYCYGPAPCVSECIAARHRDHIYTYVNKDDLVPRLCYGSVTDFRRMAINAADEADNLGQLLYAPFEDAAQQQRRWQDRFARLMGLREAVLAAQENLHLALPGAVHHIVQCRDAVATRPATPRDCRMEVAIARGRLFGGAPGSAASAAEDDGGGDSSDCDPPPTPPSTPRTIVQQDSVDTDNLADAINTPIRASFGAQPDDAQPREQQPPGPKAEHAPEKFVPVWVQRVSDGAFREIVLRSSIITDHMPSAYELAFARAIETQIYERQLRDNKAPAAHRPQEQQQQQ